MTNDISYTIRKSRRAKHLRLVVHCDGRVVVTVPRGVRQSIVERFISEKKQWVLKKLHFFENVDNRGGRVFSNKDYQKYKEEARQLVHDRIDFYNKEYGFKFNRISIKNQRTLWGSCSAKSNININYKVLFLPKELQDYLIVHEMCHLKELNHSSKFWNLVQKTVPDYKKIRKGLMGSDPKCLK